MPAAATLPPETVRDIRDRCLCLATQRAARVLARRFDRLLAPVGLTNGQFSFMIALSGARSWRMGELADFLAMDPATVSAAARTLHRRGLITLEIDDTDARARRPALTGAGRKAVAEAAILWRAEHAQVEAAVSAQTGLSPAVLAGALSGMG